MGMAWYLVEAHVREGRPVAELAASHGVHRSWIYKLLARYRADGDAGLEPRSRRPRRSPTKTAESFVSEILALRERLSKDGFDAGAHTIHAHLSRHHSDVPSPSTIWRVLKAQGLVTPQPHKRPRSSYVRFCAELPNECWQTDITCWREVEIMGVIDDHSRLCVAARAFAQVKAADVVSTFYEAASRFGLPASLLSDNGAVYTAAPRGGRCAIESELIALGIVYKHSRPYHPQTCGKVCVLGWGLPSAWAARLPAPAGLTQAKGMPGLVGRVGPIGPTLPSWSMACARFVGQRVAGGPAKLT